MCPFPRSWWTYPDGRGSRCEPLPALWGGRRAPRGTVRQPELGDIRNDAARESVGKAVDTVRIASWVRRHAVVIVPGMGVLERTLPLRPWQFPYDMFLLCAAGRMLGPRSRWSAWGERVQRAVDPPAVHRRGPVRVLPVLPGRAVPSAIRQQDLDTSGDHVYPDLAFGLARPTGVGDACGRTGQISTQHGSLRR